MNEEMIDFEAFMKDLRASVGLDPEDMQDENFLDDAE